jgi:hypothetical protein
MHKEWLTVNGYLRSRWMSLRGAPGRSFFLGGRRGNPVGCHFSRFKSDDDAMKLRWYCDDKAIHGSRVPGFRYRLIKLHSILLITVSRDFMEIAAGFGISPKARARSMQAATSMTEPLAISKNRRRSATLFRAFPSAKLRTTDAIARRS